MNEQTRKKVVVAFQAWSKASRVLWDADSICRAERRAADLTRRMELEATKRQARVVFEAANRALEETREYARREFAAARGATFSGWRIRMPSRNSARVIDHEEYLEVGEQAALITHTYMSLRNVLQFTAENELNAEVLPWSWYYPGGTIAVLLTANELLPAVGRLKPATSPAGVT